jgi:hypothetical protein
MSAPSSHRLALRLLSLAGALAASAGAAGAAPQEAPPNYEEHVQPILREWCFSCHRGSRAKNGLDLRSVKAILAGGSSGPAVVPGDHAGSLLWKLTGGGEEPHMPPDEDLPEADLAVLRAWIDAGARVDATDKGTGAVATVEAAFVPPPSAGPAPIPEGLSLQPYWWSELMGPVTALAASPGAPLLAIAAHRQVSLVRTPGGKPVGVLSFEEGQIHDLSFSASGAVLLAGGGRGADRGLAVGWDMNTGARLFEVGDEPDQVLAAHIHPDHGMVALGGPDRVVRVHLTGTGELAFELEAHTDWITAARYSPDGVLLATGDRNGGLFVWEAHTGREFHALPPVGARVTSLAWRADSNVLAVGIEDGRVRLFQMEDGRELRAFQADSAVLALDFSREGVLLTAGRDDRARTHDQQGRRQKELAKVPGPVTAVALSEDGAHALVGGFDGRVRVFHLESGEERGAIRSNPITEEQRAVNAGRAAVRTWMAEEERLAPLVAEASEQVAREAARLAEAEQAQADALQVAEAAREERDGARAALAAAGAAVAELEPEEAQRRELDASRRRRLDEARGRLAAAREDLDRALAAESAAEARALAEGGADALAARDLARTLARGAAAEARIAGEESAAAEVEALTAGARLAAWESLVQPRRDAVARAQAAQAEAEERVAAREQELAQRVASSEEARSAHGAAVTRRTALEADLQAARDQLAAAQAALPAAEEAWAAQQAALGERGRVRPAPGADGARPTASLE